ncbi:uncharacterized protein LOC135215804 [Macrobrachium nipponense]|uniref:uncharacterized protein LOC135215804 n=1 Tax=Macrobrachium nipponense TaxID=159736 RepID=UPI0030C7E4DD
MEYCSSQSADSPFCCKDSWHLALCGSRNLAPSEAGYAPVEKETLAVTWCLQKARLFQLGCPNLTIQTEGEDTPVQVSHQIHCSGFPLKVPCHEITHEASGVALEDYIQVSVACAIVATLELDIIVLDEDSIRSAASHDSVYQLLLARVAVGDWHQQKSQEVSWLHPFFSVWVRLDVNQDLVTYSVDQGYIHLVISEDLHHQVAANLQMGHQGLNSFLRRARQSVYWTGIEGDLQHHCAQCISCDEHALSLPPEEMVHMPQQKTSLSRSLQICSK